MSKEFEDLLGQYWDLAHLEGKSGVSQGDKANEVLHALKKLAEQQAQQEPVALEDAIRAEPTELIHKWRVLELAKDRTPKPAKQTCSCRWDGEMQVQQCTLHEAHVATIHEWAERAKAAEAKLKEQPDYKALYEKAAQQYNELAALMEQPAQSTPAEALDWLADQHRAQCGEDRPIQEWIRKMKGMLP